MRGPGMAFLFRRIQVHGLSMIPALASGQRLFVGRLPYVLGRPARGDVVVVHHPTRPGVLLIKRALGLPGDRVEVSPDGIVVRDGSVPRGTEPARSAATRTWTLGRGELFVVGHTNTGEDSRSFGPVTTASVVGKAWWSYWPSDRWGPVAR